MKHAATSKRIPKDICKSIPRYRTRDFFVNRIDLRQAGAGVWRYSGHVEGTGHGLGGVEYQPRTGAREREHKRLAREVAAVVDSGVAAGHCAGLVLAASNPFLGHLKAELSEQARKSVLHTLPRDYTALNEVELAKRLLELSS